MDSSLVRVRRPLPKPLMLKDHLLDELSSCSSNGFRSFPRRSPHCFTLDPPPKSSPISSLRSAVAAVAKRLSRKPPSLARILSRKLLERGGFWKWKECKPLDRLMKEDSDRWARPDSSRSSCWGSGFSASPDGTPPAEGEPVDGVAGNGAASSEQKKRSSDQEKEQLSPVSVLDYPLDDEDDEVSSVFQQREARMEGTKVELAKKIDRFECPVSLAAQFDDEKSISDVEEGKDMALEKGNHYQDHNLREGNLLLDSFREGISDNRGSSEKQRGLVEEAEEVFGRWEVEKNRRAYLVDMEKRGEWRRLDQEREEVSLEVEIEVFEEVMNELLLEICK